MFLKHCNSPAFSLLESFSPTDKFPKKSLHSCISIICECVHIVFSFLSRRPIFAVRPSKIYFSGCQFQNRLYNKSLETCKSFKLISLCNSQRRTKELRWRLLDSCLLAKRAYYHTKYAFGRTLFILVHAKDR